MQMIKKTFAVIALIFPFMFILGGCGTADAKDPRVLCDVCGDFHRSDMADLYHCVIWGWHEDEDHDHMCDICGIILWDLCEDEDHDHKCDICARIISDHVYADDFCTICGAPEHTHIDNLKPCADPAHKPNGETHFVAGKDCVCEDENCKSPLMPYVDKITIWECGTIEEEPDGICDNCGREILHHHG